MLAYDTIAIICEHEVLQAALQPNLAKRGQRSRKPRSKISHAKHAHTYCEGKLLRLWRNVRRFHSIDWLEDEREADASEEPLRSVSGGSERY